MPGWANAIAAAAVAVLAVGARASAPTYPTRPVRMVVVFSAGGTIDALARILAQKLSEQWGQSVVVDNRGGGAGGIGAIAAAQALPEGITIHLGAQSLATNITMAPVPNSSRAGISSPSSWSRPRRTC